MNVHTKRPSTAHEGQVGSSPAPTARSLTHRARLRGAGFLRDRRAACSSCWRSICRPMPARTWSRISQRLGVLAGGRLDELARIADANGPVLHARDRFGRDEDWIEYHPAYREMEEIAFGDFQFHAMSHRAGVLGLDAPLPPVAKYAFQYLFVQAEFGIMCPISVTDTSIYLIRKYASPELKAYLLPRMLSADPAVHVEGHAVHDREGRRLRRRPRRDGGAQRGRHLAALRREVVLLARRRRRGAACWRGPKARPSGTAGLALFALPRRLEDGTRNSYRIVRLKDKLGTRSMASGEIRLEGAVAYLVGRLDQGLKQMMDQVNLSRLSHGVRAAAMMRRCVNEALTVARHRVAFGKRRSSSTRCCAAS